MIILSGLLFCVASIAILELKNVRQQAVLLRKSLINKNN